MIPNYISGSYVAEKNGWDRDKLLRLFSNFVQSHSTDLEDDWLEYLNNIADMESAEF